MAEDQAREHRGDSLQQSAPPLGGQFLYDDLQQYVETAKGSRPDDNDFPSQAPTARAPCRANRHRHVRQCPDGRVPAPLATGRYKLKDVPRSFEETSDTSPPCAR